MKIRIDDIPQGISIKEIVVDIQVNENSFKVQSTTFSNTTNVSNTSSATSVAKIVSKSASVSDIKDEIQNIDLKASSEIPEEMNEQF